MKPSTRQADLIAAVMTTIRHLYHTLNQIQQARK